MADDPCLHFHGVTDSGLKDEAAHHLRFQTGAVHGAGKRQSGYSRGQRHGELLQTEHSATEGAGARDQETE